MIHHPRPAHERRAPRLIMTLHEPDCTCSACAPDRLGGAAIGKISVAAFGATTIVMAIVDPAGTTAALLGFLGR